MPTIYGIQVREFLDKNEPVYKWGRSKHDDLKRPKQYPKGSKLLLLLGVNDEVIIENIIMTHFKRKFKQRKDIGTEYFEGDFADMRKTVFGIINDYDNLSDKDIKKFYEIEKNFPCVMKELINHFKEKEKKDIDSLNRNLSIQKKQQRIDNDIKKQTIKQNRDNIKEIEHQRFKEKFDERFIIDPSAYVWIETVKEELECSFCNYKNELNSLGFSYDSQKQNYKGGIRYKGFWQGFKKRVTDDNIVFSLDLNKILKWLLVSINENKLHDNFMNELYNEFCEFDSKNKELSITKFGIILCNEQYEFPFNLGHKEKIKGKIKMHFNVKNINEWFSKNIYNPE